MENIIASSARAWVGTPFHLQGRLKGVGCDCLGLLIGVAKEVGVRTTQGDFLHEHDETNYHIINDGKYLEAKLDHLLLRKKFYEEGSLVLLEYDKNPQHIGIIGNYSNRNFTIIHSHIRRRKVVEHNLDNDLIRRIKKIYKLS